MQWQDFNTLGFPKGPVVVEPTVHYDYGTIQGSQITDSEEHSWRARKVGTLGDVGGPFFSQKKVVELNPNNLDFETSRGSRFDDTLTQKHFSGPCYPYSKIGRDSAYGFPPAMISSTAQLNTLGAKAVSITKPTNQIANLGQALGELIKDGPLSVPTAVWESVAQAGRKAGKDYLNVQFGWAPVAKDISKFLASVSSAEKILSQYERDAGRVVRRRYDFLPETNLSIDSSVINDWPEFLPVDNDYLKQFAGTLTRVRSFEQSRWFSGAFTYFMPTGFDSRSAMSRYAFVADKYLGLKITPELIWQLTPWSWAVDWFSNVGDVVSNVSSWTDDHLVMRYGYLMEHTIVKDTYTRDPSPFKNGAGTGSISLITETKQRVRANPFGFGITWEGLSPFQLSIAAALGISRSGR